MDDNREGGKYIITVTTQTGTQCQQENRHQSSDAHLVMVLYCCQTRVVQHRDNAIIFI